MRKIVPLILISLMACKPRVALRDVKVYKAEMDFFELALTQNVELLKAHLLDGSCQCENGVWATIVCEDTALNIVVLEHRLAWHLAMMRYNAQLEKTRPSKDPPAVPDPSTLCPGA